MDFVAFEYDRPFVLEGLRHGEIDYLEHVSEAAEADLFRHLIGRDVLTRLAENYPTPRKKEEVPVWLYLASQISLKLHDASYHAFPYVLRSGGLITALGPQVGRKALHPDTQDVTLACEGFNDKNTNGQRDILGVRMQRLASHLGAQRGDQAAGAQHVGEGVITGVVEFEADLASQI